MKDISTKILKDILADSQLAKKDDFEKYVFSYLKKFEIDINDKDLKNLFCRVSSNFSDKLYLKFIKLGLNFNEEDIIRMIDNVNSFDSNSHNYHSTIDKIRKFHKDMNNSKNTIIELKLNNGNTIKLKPKNIVEYFVSKKDFGHYEVARLSFNYFMSDNEILEQLFEFPFRSYYRNPTFYVAPFLQKINYNNISTDFLNHIIQKKCLKESRLDLVITLLGSTNLNNDNINYLNLCLLEVNKPDATKVSNLINLIKKKKLTLNTDDYLTFLNNQLDFMDLFFTQKDKHSENRNFIESTTSPTGNPYNILNTYLNQLLNFDISNKNIEFLGNKLANHYNLYSKFILGCLTTNTYEYKDKEKEIVYVLYNNISSGLEQFNAIYPIGRDCLLELDNSLSSIAKQINPKYPELANKFAIICQSFIKSHNMNYKRVKI